MAQWPSDERRTHVRRSTDACNISTKEVAEIFLRLKQTCDRISRQMEAQQKDHDLLMQRSNMPVRVDKVEAKIDALLEYHDNARGAGRFILWSTAVLAALASVAAFIWRNL